MSELTPESQRRLDWRLRHIGWLLPRIAGDAEDKEQFLAMFDAALSQAFYEGTKEAEALVLRIGEEIKRPVPLDSIAGYIGRLAERNRADIIAIASKPHET